MTSDSVVTSKNARRMLSQYRRRSKINQRQSRGCRCVSKKKQKKSKHRLRLGPRASPDHQEDALKLMLKFKSPEPLMWNSSGLNKKGSDWSAKLSNKKTNSFQRSSLRKLSKSRTRSRGGRNSASDLTKRPNQDRSSKISLKSKAKPQPHSESRNRLRPGNNQK